MCISCMHHALFTRVAVKQNYDLKIDCNRELNFYFESMRILLQVLNPKR